MNTKIMLLGALMGVSTAALPNNFHPNIPLLDRDAQRVIDTGKALSTMVTCGQCHDTAFIASSSDHADAGAQQLGSGTGSHKWQAGPGYYGGWDPLRYDNALGEQGEINPETWLKLFGARHVGGGPVSDWVEIDCLLCHSDLGGQNERGQALQRGDFEWANSMAFSQGNILTRGENGWQWNVNLFQADGSLIEGLLDVREPRDENCAQCHGLVDSSLEQPLTIPADLSQRSMTDRTGQIFSPQKLSNSGLNLENKDSLDHAFDVHSDRVVACVNCHYSLNNPVYFQQREESRPAHLDFDPRRLSSADYLERPLHQFAKGKSILGLAATGSENSLRRCESCHNAAAVHDWLPFREGHLSSLSCESCHIPKLYGPALQSLDWTLPDREGQPRRQYRNIEGNPASAQGLIRGYRPVMLARMGIEGKRKLAPFNLISSWYWVAGNPARPVSRQAMIAAFYDGDEFHPDLLVALDDDSDGKLAGDELRLDTPERAEAVRHRLQASGLSTVHLKSEITPFSINHDVVNGQWATRECSSCHGEDSILAAAMLLSDYTPGGMTPSGGIFPAVSLNGVIESRDDGASLYRPDTRADGFYIIGLDQVGWIDVLGLAMFFGISLGVTVHALARYYFNRRHARLHPAQHHTVRRVYMYDSYERLWHWLQASAILLLLATGLIIHKPHIFGMFSFAYVVRVHNVLGFILLINAALALFYNLASGQIRQYLPEPRGFIGRTVAQAMYYSQGIFAGKPHPLEKTKEHKLNPLQQVTYLIILNVLLPAQVVTGVLIWGLQKWPQIASSLGGLPILAPIHSLVAWAFAAFIVMHVYLTTAAGKTPAAGIKSMVSGWEEVEVDESAEEATSQPGSRA